MVIAAGRVGITDFPDETMALGIPQEMRLFTLSALSCQHQGYNDPDSMGEVRMKPKCYFNISLKVYMACASVFGRNVHACVHVCAHVWACICV